MSARSARSARRVAWAVDVLVLTLALVSGVVSELDGDRLEADRVLFPCAIALVFAVAGHVIATRRPGNAIGWLFLGVAASAPLGMLAGAYAEYWIATGRGPDRLGEAAAVYGSVSWIPFVLVPATFLLLLFPDGRLLSPRWRPVAWLAGLSIAVALVSGLFVPGPLEDYPEIPNPYGVDSGLVDAVSGLSILAVGVSLLCSAATVILRFRRARGEERLQMKWIAFAGAVAAVTIVVMTALYDVVGEDVANASIMGSILTLPAATAIAIVRYRLYDIDVVINRALVYGSLTGVLAGVYVGSVLLLQLGLDGVTQDSSLAVAASTLAVAGLFRPVRGRIQRTVDRRFFRSRYDAARTLVEFGMRVRDEVELGTLSDDLQAVVNDTMRPAHVSLWLRTPERT